MKLEKKISLNWKKYPVGFKLGKNPVHQTRYFKLENWKNPVQIDRGKVRRVNMYLNLKMWSKIKKTCT